MGYPGGLKLSSISIVTADWLVQFKAQMASSDYYQKKITKWEVGKLDGSKYSLKDGLLYHKNRL